MIIGFNERFIFINESDIPKGSDEIQLTINVTSLRTSEQEYTVQFRLQEGSTNAFVETITPSNPEYDARFGSRQSMSDPITESRIVEAGSLQLRMELITFVRNDFRPEGLECYTIRILSPDLIGIREIFGCYEDNSATNFFCLHTICVEDDDGQFS